MLNPNVPANYVFGIDRNGALPTGPFAGRPDIRFDALVVISVTPGKATTASVIDLTGKNKPVALPTGTFFAAGNEVLAIVQVKHSSWIPRGETKNLVRLRAPLV